MPKLDRVIALLEQKLQLDVRYFVSGMGALWLTQAFLLASGLAFTVFFARIAGAEGYGQLQFVLAVMGTISLVTLPGVNTVVSVLVARGSDGAVLEGLKTKVKYSFFGVVALILSAVYVWFTRGSLETGRMIVVGAVFFPLMYCFDVTHAFYVGKKQISRSCFVQVFTEGLPFWVSLGVLVWVKSVLLAFVALVATEGIAQALGFVFATRKVWGAKKEEVLSLGWRLTLVNALGYVRSNVEKVIVTFFLGFAGTAMYAVASAVAEQLSAIGKQVGLLALPKLAQDGQLRNALWRRKGLLIVFFGGLGGLLALASPFLIKLLFSAEYKEAWTLAPLFIVSSIPYTIGLVWVKALEVESKTDALYKVYGIHSALEIAGFALMIPFLGLIGVVIAKAIAGVIFLGLLAQHLIVSH